jgi:hypothetical protein
MKLTNDHTRRSLVALVALGAGLAACSNGAETGELDPRRALPAAEAKPRATTVALTIEQAERALDVGRAPADAKKLLEGVVADPSATVEERDQATLALSRALELSGDTEGAITRVEALLAAHAEDKRWPMETAASDRLRKLVTGHDEDPHRLRLEADEEVAPFAHALTRYFTPANDGAAPGKTTQITILTFHGESSESSKLGTWNIAGALKAERREACPFCDDTMQHTSTWRSGEGSWTALPKRAAQLRVALGVFYFDLGEGRVPARYDAELPMPSAEIAARLEKGEGLVMARERPNAPPVILIAAPREAQLGLVEAALAAMKTLPLEPITVPIAAGLRPSEIQGVIRGATATYRKCYEAVLEKAPEVAVKVELAFTVREDGSVERPSIGEASTLHDATLERCFLDVTSALVFPAGGTRITVGTPRVVASEKAAPAAR